MFLSAGKDSEQLPIYQVSSYFLCVFLYFLVNSAPYTLTMSNTAVHSIAAFTFVWFSLFFEGKRSVNTEAGLLQSPSP